MMPDLMLHEAYPGLSDQVPGAGIACSWVVLAFGVFFVLQPKARKVGLNPNKRKYVLLIERGQWWTDEQIAYQENQSATARCVHLQPVERAMRSAGIVPRRLTEPWHAGLSRHSRVWNSIAASTNLG